DGSGGEREREKHANGDAVTRPAQTARPHPGHDHRGREHDGEQQASVEPALDQHALEGGVVQVPPVLVAHIIPPRRRGPSGGILPPQVPSGSTRGAGGCAWVSSRPIVPFASKSLRTSPRTISTESTAR